jgi:hypothetical protein
MKNVQLVGTFHYEEAYSLEGGSGDFPLDYLGTLAQVIQNELSIAGSYAVAAPLPAKVVGVRVKSGGPITLTLNGIALPPISDRLLLVSADSPFSSVAVAGTAVIELLVGA